MKGILLTTALFAAGAALADIAWKKTPDGLEIANGGVTRRLAFYGAGALRVKSDAGADYWRHPSLAVVAPAGGAEFRVEETDTAVNLVGPSFTARVAKADGAIVFVDAKGEVLLAEAETPVELKTVVIDGERTYEVTQRWRPAAGEGLYGLGQSSCWKFNLRGERVLLAQTNVPAFSPVFSSSKGWLILWDVYSQTVFHDRSEGLSLWSESAPGGSDYYFCYGPDADDKFRAYRHLTGAATMFPKAALGYFQSKERYQSQQELIDVVAKFRALRYPLDFIVQDWQYWDPAHDHWNAMVWDPKRYPDPKALCDTLHDDFHVKLMNSIWPDVGDDTEVARELDRHGLRFLKSPTGEDLGHWISQGHSHVYDAYSPLGREIYFRHLKRGLVDVGVDAMWMDGSELETRDACHGGEQMVRNIKACGRNALGDFTRYLNTYGLMTVRGNYEGQRATSNRRTFTLTRSAWAGLQRYAAIPWSGDTGASWNRLREEVAAGLLASMSGLPYWTQDTGGFFCGSMAREMTNPQYLELLARWNQFAIFNPVYRWHSAGMAKEPWLVKDTFPDCYESYRQAAELRYRLMPYLYALMRDTHETGRPLVRPVVLDYPASEQAVDRCDAFTFGPALFSQVILEPWKYGRAATRAQLVPGSWLTTADGRPGFRIEYFRGEKFEQKVSETVDGVVNYTWPGPPLIEWPEGLASSDRFSARLTGRITFPKAGVWEIGVAGDDGFALFLDGQEVLRDWDYAAERPVIVKFAVKENALAHDFRIDYFNGTLARALKFLMRTPEQVAEDLTGESLVSVRLPQGCGWYDFWTGQPCASGATVLERFELDRFPLYAKAGSILPLGPAIEWATQKSDEPTELRVYAGADASFVLYEDDNETYDYERGAFVKIPLRWHDGTRTLEIGAAEGSFPGFVADRTYVVTLVTPQGSQTKTVAWQGRRLRVGF
ncbi:MAG: TIM-barrel domain-containing protein [Kiritimatiellia bacterium]